MDYKIAIGSSAKNVEIKASDEDNPDEYLAKVKEENNQGEVKIAVLKVEGTRIILSIQKKVYSVVLVEKSPTEITYSANGKSIHSKIAEPTKNHGMSSLVATTNELITSNFPAKVVKLVVKKGDALKEGQTLIVLEAMKMEAQIKAPHDCKVEEVYVKEGDMVAKGKPLIRLEFG